MTAKSFWGKLVGNRRFSALCHHAVRKNFIISGRPVFRVFIRSLEQIHNRFDPVIVSLFNGIKIRSMSKNQRSRSGYQKRPDHEDTTANKQSPEKSLRKIPARSLPDMLHYFTFTTTQNILIIVI